MGHVSLHSKHRRGMSAAAAVAAESIHGLAAQYRLKTGIAGLKVQYSSTKGFYLLVPNQHVTGAAGEAGAGGEGAKEGSADRGATSKQQLGRSGTVPQLPK